MKALKRDWKSTLRWKPIYATYVIVFGLILSSASACATRSEPELRPLDFCEVYQPVYDLEHPVVELNNAIYFKFCLGEGRDA